MSRNARARTPTFGTREVESELAHIWSDVLGLPIDRIGVDDNFFMLGGDSLLIARVMDRVNTLFFADRPDDALPITRFFSHGTIRALAQELSSRLAIRGGEESAAPRLDAESIAVVGMAGRFPGASDIGAFWRSVSQGIETIQSFSDSQLIDAGVSAAELRQPGYVKRGALLEDVRCFDADYFGLTPREAELTSPEQRLLLECSEEALQDAGYGARERDRRIGVFVGTGLSTYLLDQLVPSLSQLESTAGMALIVANTSAATRISYLLDLTGPGITIDTACSSSLVAVHQACRAILNGECAMALAGGATVRRFGPRGYHAEEGGIFSPDGHCRPFDRHAQGTVSSSGAGMVLLKRLSAAIADGDTIHAVIRGTAINNDGGAKVGYTAPSATGQASVIQSALQAAGVDASGIQYVETHGTATALGDLIEIAALNEVFPAHRAGGERCTLGTLKANMGHLEAAAGIAGLIKAALALKHRQMPPAIHFQEPNEALALERTAFTVNTQLRDWPSTGTPRRAGVSSFGIGGTNAHAVLEEAASAPAGGSHRTDQLLVLSARSEAALRTSCRRLSAHLADDAGASLADVAYTLQLGRKHHPYRHFVVASGAPEAARALDDSGTADMRPAPTQGESVPVVFMFPGQGSQYARMAWGIYESEPVFREHIDHCAQILHPALGRDLRGVLNGPADALEQTELCQPALFAVEYSLARLLQSWGATPSSMIGHSLGEYVAACVSGLFTLQDALTVVAARGRLMQKTPAGKMLAVRMGRDHAARLLGKECSLAAVNGPNSTVISGPAEHIDRLKGTLDAMNVPSTVLLTSHAFHSSLMDGILDEFAGVLRNVGWGEIRIPYVSNLTGQPVDRELVASPDYWISHLRQTVDFSAGMQTLLSGPSKLFIEVGPGTVLGSLVRGMSDAAGQEVVACGRRADDPAKDASVLLNAVGRLWQRGVAIDWRAFNANNSPRRVSLPTYPFDRQRYWIERKQPDPADPSPAQPERLALPDWFYVPIWKQKPRLARHGTATARASAQIPDACCLVVEGWAQLEEALIERLARSGTRVIPVRMTDRNECENGRYTLNAQEASAFSWLFADLKSKGLTATLIVHAAEAAPDSHLPPAMPDDKRLARGVYNVLDLCQALMSQEAHPVTLALMTRSAHIVIGDEASEPTKAMLAAVAPVIAGEVPDIACRCIDFTAPSGQGRGQASLMNALVDEIVSPADDELVAFRGGSRWVRSYEKLSPGERGEDQLPLRTGGVYLVTGGMGGIGWTLAEFLARTAKARLILVARTPFPDRGEWQTVLQARDPEDADCRRIREICALESAGAQVLVVQADVSCQEDMNRVAALACERFGGVHGVIHAAGVAAGGTILLKTREMAARVMAPKVMGTWAVYEACRELEPDFFICCSSIAAVLSPPGLYDYCAANAFQDAFCRAHDGRTRTRFISINWDSWRTVGMAVNTEVPLRLREQRARALAAGLTCEEGARVFELILANPLPQWIVSTQGLDPVADSHHRARRARPNELSREVDSGTNTAQHGRAGHDSLSAAGSASEQDASHAAIESTLAHLWKELLGVEARTADDDFFELGGDSLLAVQLRTRLESHFSRSVPLKALLSRTTLAGMARFLQEAR